LVTTLYPETIETYKKVVDSNGKIKPLFIVSLTEYEDFEFASEGTMRREIWKQILKQKGGTSSSFIAGEDVIKLFDSIREHKAVVLSAISPYQNAWHTNLCLLLKTQGRPDNILILRDPSEKKSLIHWVVRRSLMDGSTNTFRPADRVMNSFFETGINLKAYDLENFALSPQHDLDPEVMRVCLSNVIQTPMKDFVDKDLTSFVSLFYYFICFMLCWLLVPSMEMFVRIKHTTQ